MTKIINLPQFFADDPFLNEAAKPYTQLSTCILITKVLGSPVGLTDHNTNLTIDGVIYYSDGGVSPANTSAKSDMSLDTSEIVSLFSANSITKEQVLKWGLDNAKVRVFLVNRGDLTRTYTLKDGYIGLVGLKNNMYSLEVVGKAAKLTHQVGRTYSPSCDTKLFSSRCGLDVLLFNKSATVSSIVNKITFNITIAFNTASGYFAGGKLTWNTGQNSGVVIEIKNDTEVSPGNRSLEIFSEVPYTISVGDTMTITPGCDKSLTACREKFNNLVNFQGQPHVPGGAPGGDKDNAKQKTIKA